MIRTRMISCFAGFLTAALLAAPATAQVHGPGPSDPSLFDTVINVPDELPSIGGSIGNSNGDATPTTQLNVEDLGSVGSRFSANSGSEVNIRGGTVAERFRAWPGSEVNISGGEVGHSFSAQLGSVVNIAGGSVGGAFSAHGLVDISGGSVGSEFTAGSNSVVNITGGSLDRGFEALSGSTVNISNGRFGTEDVVSNSYAFLGDGGSQVNISGGSFGGFYYSFFAAGVANISGGNFGFEFEAYGSDVQLIGGEFELNGVAYTEPTITLANGDIFTGTLADGSSFIFLGDWFDTLDGVTLSPSSLPTLDAMPRLVNTNISATAPSGLRAGQTLTLVSGGVIGDNFAAVSATLNIEGGVVGRGLEASGSVINISGGSVGEGLIALSGSEVNISGGIIRERIHLFPGSVVNVSGGSVDTLSALYDTEVTINGGTFGRLFADSRSNVELIGEEYKLNGVGFTGSSITLDAGDVFTGTLADGSVFLFRGQFDRLGDVTLTSAQLPPLDTTPRVVNSDVSTTAPFGLRAGQTLTVEPGGVLSNGFAIVDATLNVQDGLVGRWLETTGGEVNISGGSVGEYFGAYSGSTVNISGGDVGDGFDANSGSVVNISGGTVGDHFDVDGSSVRISGGTIGDNFEASGCDVTISDGRVGREFKAVGSVVNISGGNVGAGFIARDGSEVSISGGSVSRNLSVTSSVANVRGGYVGSFGAHSGSKVNISGGTVGSFAANNDSVVNISGGRVNSESNASSGSTVNISGGRVGNHFDAHFGSVVNISGGILGDTFNAEAGSKVYISGASFGEEFRALSASWVKISGGSVGSNFHANSGSDVDLVGGEFQLNGVAYSDATISLAEDDIFTGTLADGSSFVFTSLASDELYEVKLTTVALHPADTTLRVVNSDITATTPSGLRAGQEMSVQPGGVLGGHFAVVDATLSVEGGVVGSGLEVARGEVKVGGGSVGDYVRAYSGSVVNISSGSVGGYFDANSGSVVNISGGSVGDYFGALSGSVVNISGGSVGERSRAHTDSVVNISGGSIGARFQVNSGGVVNIRGGEFGASFTAFGEVNLFGTEFFLDGELLETLVLDETFTITTRAGAVLSGTLTDGSAFSFDLMSRFISGEDYFPSDTLTVTLVTPGNFDLDRDVDGTDFLHWQRNARNRTLADWQAKYGSPDHGVNGGDFLQWQRNPGFGDLADWQANYGNMSDGAGLEATSLPEPSTAMLVLVVVLTCTGSSRRRHSNHWPKNRC